MENGTAPEFEETYNSVSDVQHVAEELAVHSVISEERHEEILEETDNVCKRLDQLSAELKTSNETLTGALTAEVIALKGELIALKSELVNLKQSQVIPPSVPLNGPTPEPTSEVHPPNEEEDHPEVKIVETPAPIVNDQPKKRRRI
jgi:hypothetical protein